MYQTGRDGVTGRGVGVPDRGDGIPDMGWGMGYLDKGLTPTHFTLPFCPAL